MIYILHGEKDKLMDIYRDDPGISETAVQQIKKTAKELLHLYGKPIKIMSSPFRICRETAYLMNSVLSNPLEEVEIDNKLCLEITTCGSYHPQTLYYKT